jgi:hypothetical protein
VDVVLLLKIMGSTGITIENLLRDDMQFIIDDNTEDELIHTIFLNRFDISELVNKNAIEEQHWTNIINFMQGLFDRDYFRCLGLLKSVINEVAIYNNDFRNGELYITRIKPVLDLID